MPTSSALQYVPTSPPQDPRDVPRYLDDELNRVALAINELNTRVITAVPWKGLMAYIVGVSPGTGNPTYSNSYNVASVVRTAIGKYRVTLQFPAVQSVLVLPLIYPVYTLQVDPANYPLDTKLFLMQFIPVDSALGIFDVQVLAGTEGANGKLTLVAYDLKTGDGLWLQGFFNLGGGAQDIVYSNLGSAVTGEF